MMPPPNRRVRTRTPGGAGGVRPRGFPLSRLNTGLGERGYEPAFMASGPGPGPSRNDDLALETPEFFALIVIAAETSDAMIINLNQYRKKRRRTDAETQAKENRVRFGRSKEERSAELRERDRAKKEIENKRLE